jgi:hypothetical protein
MRLKCKSNEIEFPEKVLGLGPFRRTEADDRNRSFNFITPGKTYEIIALETDDLARSIPSLLIAADTGKWEELSVPMVSLRELLEQFFEFPSPT